MASRYTISIAKDYSPHPGPRFIRQGRNSGEKFRGVLAKALRSNDFVVVDLDGTTGFGSSFLDEAFGGLIRNEGFTLNELNRRLEIKSLQDETYVELVNESLRQAAKQA